MEKEVDFRIKLHPGQNQVFDCKAKTLIINAGTRWGKTELCAYMCIDYGLEFPNLKAPIWWVSPTYSLAETGLNKMYQIAPRGIFGTLDKRRFELPLISGAKVCFKSADNPVSLLSQPVSKLFIDEAAQMPDEVFTRYLQRATLDYNAQSIAFSTPKGKNWFYDQWLKGQDPLEKNHNSFKFKTEENPFINKKVLAMIKENTPEIIWLQEYEADFLDDASSVFRNIEECISGELGEPTKGKFYQIGIDVAKYQDFWVSIIIDRETKRVVGFDRSRELDWGFQKARTVLLADKWNKAKIIIDSTGVGDPIYEDLYRAGLNIEPFHFTSVTKRQLIENLALMIQQRSIHYPAIPELLNELKSFECEPSGIGGFKYGAPSGKHDDCVIALALACWGLNESPALISAENFLTGVRR